MKLYLLELMISDLGKVICEPLGIYSSEEDAQKYSQMVQERFPVTQKSNMSLNILEMESDTKPFILDFKAEPNKEIIEELVYFYRAGIIDQVVETDGTFSYVVAPKFKSKFEKALSFLSSE